MPPPVLIVPQGALKMFIGALSQHRIARMHTGLGMWDDNTSGCRTGMAVGPAGTGMHKMARIWSYIRHVGYVERDCDILGRKFYARKFDRDQDTCSP